MRPKFVYIRPSTRSGLMTLVQVGQVVESLRRGEAAILPTETGYMLAADALNLSAVRRVFDIKSRPTTKPMHIACSSLEMAERYGQLNHRARDLMGCFTPGPLTLVVEQTDLLPESLVTLNGTVGIRVPDCAPTLQIIQAFNRPLTATSLNESGASSTSLDQAELSELNWPADSVTPVVESRNPIMHDQPSTLARINGSEIEILRRGPIVEDQLRARASRISPA